MSYSGNEEEIHQFKSRNLSNFKIDFKNKILFLVKLSIIVMYQNLMLET